MYSSIVEEINTQTQKENIMDIYTHPAYVKGTEFKFMVSVFRKDDTSESTVWTHLGDFKAKLAVENMEFIKAFREILAKVTPIKEGSAGSTIIDNGAALDLVLALQQAGFRFSKRELAWQTTVTTGTQALAIFKKALKV